MQTPHSPSWIRKSLYSALVFFGTLITLSVGYATWNATMSKVSSGNPLSAAGWNALVDNIADLDSRWSRSGGNLVFTGGNVGIGTVSPAAKLHIIGSPSSNTFVVGTTVAASGGVVIKPEWGPGIASIQGTRSGLDGVANLAINPEGGNVGIGTVSPSEKLDLWGGNIKMGLSYQNNITIATGVASQTMSPSYQICPTGTSIIGATCWTAASGNVACPAYYGIGGNGNIQAWNCGNTTANMLCSAICANMK